MPRSLIPTICGAVICFLIGLMLYQSQAGVREPAMSMWACVSFASLGACIGCLSSPEEENTRGKKRE